MHVHIGYLSLRKFLYVDVLKVKGIFPEINPCFYREMTRHIICGHLSSITTNLLMKTRLSDVKCLQHFLPSYKTSFDFHLNKMHLLSNFHCRQFHSSPYCCLEDDGRTTKSVQIHNLFNQADRDKVTFMCALEAYTERDTLRRGHVEFIYAALKYMEEYGVLRDLEAYKKILDIFPKGKFIPKNRLQAEFWHFPKQQHCGLYLLEQIEYNRLIPDDEMKEMILNIFGRYSYVHRKFMRMMYWLPKFKNINPYPLPQSLPKEALELAKLALKQMSVDPQTKLTVYQTEELEDSIDNTWIVSAQCPKQQELIKELPQQQPIYVEGAFVIWLRQTTISYFILRGKSKQLPNIERDLDDVTNIPLFMFGEKDPGDIVKTSLHEQEDGIILGMCATGTSSKDSLLSWVRFLQETNTRLSEIPILFTLRSPSKDLSVININAWSDFDDIASTEMLPDCNESKS